MVDSGILLKLVMGQRVIESYYKIVVVFFSVYPNTLLALFKVVGRFSDTVFILISFLFN